MTAESNDRAGPAKAHLEYVNGRLMDGADDRAASVDGVANRPHDDGSGTSVQAAGRLVHEHDRRVGH